MCGIVGVSPCGERQRAVLTAMRDTLVHRGPDDAGLWIDPRERVGFGHRRLSIIDLSDAGRQPMHDPSGEVAIVFNGEIYNHRQLRPELERAGWCFRSRSDTEVALAAYQRWGIGCLARFNGMFAIAIHDARSGEIHLARDRVGKKPLYYAVSRDGELVFASELKALLVLPGGRRPVDGRALNAYLALGYVPGDQCILAGVRKLDAAHLLTYSPGSGAVRIQRYWEIPAPSSAADLGEVDALDRLQELLEDSARLRLESDVPVGALLSGGLDSSLVVTALSRVAPGQVKTYTIGFGEQSHDERRHASLVARYLGTDHHEYVVEPSALDELPMMADQFDEPLADPSLLPTHMVARLARKEVTVALSGDGGDELFAGYLRYPMTLAEHAVAARLPGALRRLAAGAGAALPEGTRGRNGLRRVGMSFEGSFVAKQALFDEEQRRDLLDPRIVSELGGELGAPERAQLALLEERPGARPVERMTYADLKSYLVDDVLVKVDRASMLHGLEVRSPLLDHRLVEFAFTQVSPELKLRGRQRKYLLAQLARRWLPAEFPVRRKQGFVLPLAAWFRGPYRDVLEEHLADVAPYLRPGVASRSLRRHVSGERDESARLFAILMFALWRDRFAPG